MLYLLLSIPTPHRVSFSTRGRMGIGIVEPRTHSLAIVSVRSPWGAAAEPARRRARWRLDTYGSDGAANRLEQLLDEWHTMQRRGQTTLHITGTVRGGQTSLSFGWVSSNANE